MQFFEERLDDYDLEVPECIIASGLPRVGRSSLLFNALVKSNRIELTYKPANIILECHDGIEDFILKLFDLGFSGDEIDVTNLISKDIKEKTNILVNLILGCQNANEIVVIHDNGCLINYDGSVSEWLQEAMSSKEIHGKIVFCLATRFRVHNKIGRIRFYSSWMCQS